MIMQAELICPRDLIIGNFVNRKYYNPHPKNPSWELERCEIVGTRINSVIAKIKGGSHSVLDYWEAIPLSEDLLLNLGFDLTVNIGNQGEFNVYSLNGITYNTNHGWWFSMRYLEFQPKYIHQLQNIYFYLTGESLTYEPTNKIPSVG